ncbi:hypothetical protein A2U01_0100567, partial [Trifolium medium]|nr:hypothetical protein [Trifolium medium]
MQARACAIQGSALRKVQSQKLLPETLPARCARDKSYPDIPVSSFQGNHNKSPPCL